MSVLRTQGLPQEVWKMGSKVREVGLLRQRHCISQKSREDTFTEGIRTRPERRPTPTQKLGWPCPVGDAVTGSLLALGTVDTETAAVTRQRALLTGPQLS